MKESVRFDRDAFIEQERELYCKDCDRRKGMKNGRLRFIYEIGEVPCRSCWLDNCLDELEDYPVLEDVVTELLARIGEAAIVRALADAGACEMDGALPDEYECVCMNDKQIAINVSRNEPRRLILDEDFGWLWYNAEGPEE